MRSRLAATVRRLPIRLAPAEGHADDVLGRRVAGIESRLARIEKELASTARSIALAAPPRLKARDPDFRPLATVVAREGRTLLGPERLWTLWQCVRNVAPLGLPAAEVGSYRGGSARFLATAAASLGAPVPLHVVDTFDGHPTASLSERDKAVHVPGLFGDTSFEDVAAYLGDLEQVHLHRGRFEEIRDELPDGPYGFAHLDVDLYTPMLEGLRFFGARLAVGGTIVLDDFDSRNCPGVREAFEAWQPEAEGRFHAFNPLTQQLVLTRVG